jgi:hypothetical protein
MKLFDACQNIQPLIFAQEDRSLSMPERTRKWAHFVICKGCRQVQTNVATLREGLKAWRNGTDD